MARLAAGGMVLEKQLRVYIIICREEAERNTDNGMDF